MLSSLDVKLNSDYANIDSLAAFEKQIMQKHFVKEKIPFSEVKAILETSKINFPFIVKPDIGLRGSAVKKVINLEELKGYHSKANFDYLLQDLIPYENEVGIFYVRFPHEKHGKITGIVAKEFLTVEGDGNSSIV